ncbi:hypothetical protein PsorP6_017100 [Peronosclerospora sorghi]|uniref:Uncharacterized protein n=1 Tax=Peronosclerospora sorghi TaxID=230839 RepID=A0ACC0WE74_9STRA|nr:hypothetical protein PsorP6_017100 [Peronosclerospora sorghi]
MPHDTVKQAPYCIVCRCSSAIAWRHHVFTKRHKQCAIDFLAWQVTRLQTMRNDVATSHASDPWRCVFCPAVAVAARDALAHCSTKSHRKHVEKFCRHHRCDLEHELRRELWQQPPTRCPELPHDPRHPSPAKASGDGGHSGLVGTEQTRGNHMEAFLSSAASRVHQVSAESCQGGAKTPNDAVAAVPVARPRRSKTGTCSARGSSPGRQQGKRVGENGMDAVRKTERIMIPWTLDHLETKGQTKQETTQTIGTDGTRYTTHRVTELALRNGVTSIAPVPWGASVGNVHTAAIPPWMVQTEEEYKQCNRREPLARRTTDQRDRKRQASLSDEWLPNFGGVWQEGPRSKTKQAFRNARRAATALGDRKHPLDPIQSNPLPLQEPARKRRETQPPPPQQVAHAHLDRTSQQAAPLSRPCESSIDTTSTECPLAAKKQLLLAQKERLRAKIAAKRRQ